LPVGCYAVRQNHYRSSVVGDVGPFGPPLNSTDDNLEVVAHTLAVVDQNVLLGHLSCRKSLSYVSDLYDQEVCLAVEESLLVGVDG